MRRFRFDVIILGLVAIIGSLFVPSVVQAGPADFPTVETDNADINGTSVTMNGEITDTGATDPTANYRGFVWGVGSQANPGDTAPNVCSYADYWVEGGAFGVTAFSHEITGFLVFTTYYCRAFAHTVTGGWAYGEELTFFTLEDGKVYVKVRPRLDEARIRAGGVPDAVEIDVFYGYSLPIWSTPANQDEELYFAICVPDRWDGESDIICHIHTALSDANETGNRYRLNVSWEHATPNEDVIPTTHNTKVIERDVHSDNQYQFYMDWTNVTYNIDPGDDIEPEDILAVRIRRVAAKSDDLNGELIIIHVGFLFARGDLLGEPWEIILEDDMTIVAFMLLCLGLMIIAYIWKKQAVMVSAGLAWMVFAFWMRAITPTWGTWNVYEGLFWLGLAMVFLCFAEAIVLARKVPKEDIAAEDADRDVDEMGEYDARLARLRRRR